MMFHIYELHAETLCLGERIKGGLLRPCSRTLRYSTITSALRKTLDRNDLHAVGTLETGRLKSTHLVYSPQDRVLSVAKIPLTVEYLVGVEGHVYLPSFPGDIPDEVNLVLGAFRSKGFGRTVLKYKGQKKYSITEGKLGIRVPEVVTDIFGIEILRPTYGYLWQPDELDPITKGKYVLSLFENTLCRAPQCFLKEELLWTLLKSSSLTVTQ